VKADIDVAKDYQDLLMQESESLGHGGELNQSVFSSALKKNPWFSSSPSFVTVANWLATGGKTVFLQDADSLIMKTPDLLEVLNYIKSTFPSVDRITSYARSKTALKKSLDSLKKLKEAGLTRLHIGLETGDGELLKKVKKGITPEEQIESGKKVIAAGIQLSLYIMPGLGGIDLSMQHAKNTAGVLNAINPHYIRSRPFVPRRNTPSHTEYEAGEFRLLSPHGILTEIGMLVNELTVTSKLCFDHMLNPTYRSDHGLVPLLTQSYEGYELPEQKEEILGLIKKGLAIEESKFICAQDMINASL
jgi:radical SAM superfamily enzyme YgiQ (UPF0313 family)